MSKDKKKYSVHVVVAIYEDYGPFENLEFNCDGNIESIGVMSKGIGQTVSSFVRGVVFDIRYADDDAKPDSEEGR